MIVPSAQNILGNNVFGCCIKDVQGYNCCISIELLYTREDLTKYDSEGRRLFLSDEFTEKSKQLKNNAHIVCHNKTLNDAYKKKIIKIVDKEVFDNEENSLALSKESFSQNIRKRSIVGTDLLQNRLRERFVFKVAFCILLAACLTKGANLHRSSCHGLPCA